MEVFFPWTAGNEFQGLSVNGTQDIHREVARVTLRGLQPTRR
jgi:hypothetical protein